MADKLHPLGAAPKEMLRVVWKIARKMGLCDDEWEPWYAVFAASTVWPVARNGKIIGGVLLHGMPENKIMLHLVIEPKWTTKWVNKEIIRAFRGWRPGVEVIAPVNGQEKAARAFGFVPTEQKQDGYTFFSKGA